MRAGQLRAILQALVVAGCSKETHDSDLTYEVVTPGCDEQAEIDVRITPPVGAELMFLVDRCRLDAVNCQDLCVELMTRLEEDYFFPRVCEVELDDEKTLVHMEYDGYSCGGGDDVGRRPCGLAERPFHAQTGARLARMAWLEAASVHAFVRLAVELASYAAPHGLIEVALQSARDEVRHAEIMTKLAARYGAVPPRVDLEPMTTRTLEQIALENAVEGCVRETWGAVVALWQAQTARDPEVRIALASIAADEVRHASLAWSIDAWLRTRLDAGTMARIDAARSWSARRLLDEPIVGDAMLGLPDEREARRLAQRTHGALWA